MVVATGDSHGTAITASTAHAIPPAAAAAAAGLVVCCAPTSFGMCGSWSCTRRLPLVCRGHDSGQATSVPLPTYMPVPACMRSQLEQARQLTLSQRIGACRHCMHGMTSTNSSVCSQASKALAVRATETLSAAQQQLLTVMKAGKVHQLSHGSPDASGETKQHLRLNR